jgi:hypothetical protein
MRFLLDSRLSTVFEDSINWASSSSWYSSSYSLVVDQDSLLSEDVTLSIGHFRVTDSFSFTFRVLSLGELLSSNVEPADLKKNFFKVF